MNVSRITLVLVLAFGTLASAQNTNIQIQKLPTQTRPQSSAAQVDEVGLLRRDVLRLRTELQDLKNQIAALRQSQPDLPKCSDRSHSASKLGTRDCSPFACDAATGTCISSCNSSMDCRGGAVCDTGYGRCVVPEPQ